MSFEIEVSRFGYHNGITEGSRQTPILNKLPQNGIISHLASCCNKTSAPTVAW